MPTSMEMARHLVSSSFSSFPTTYTRSRVQHVVQDDNHDDQYAGGHQVRGVRGYYGCHDGHNRQGRNQRQNLYHRLGEFLEEMVNQEAQHDGQDHDLYDGKEHAPDIHVYRLPGVEIGQSRVRNGARIVEHAVIPTERATSPLDR